MICYSVQVIDRVYNATFPIFHCICDKSEMQQIISPMGVIILLHVILHGGVIWIFQNGGWKFCMKSSIWFFTIILSFLEKKMFFRSVFKVSLFTSVVCYCQNGLRRKHGKCSLCNERWHFFMDQRLNHLVLLYKCNCIRIISLNTFNKNVGIIWHYCIISQIKLHGFWKRSALTIYEERRIEVYDK